MENRKFLSDELLASLDVINTLSGGVSEPQTKLKKFQDYSEISLKVPGVNTENLKVEIHNNMLRVLYTFSFHSEVLSINMPRMVYNKAVPYFVDVTRITATFTGGSLIVTLPFNELAKGYHRTISTGS